MSICYGMKDGKLQFYEMEYEEPKQESEQESGIPVSDNYGLNPSIEICTICGKDIGIVLFGKLENDKKAPKEVCLGNLCDNCKKKLEENNNVILIEINELHYPTGKYCIISKLCLNSEYIKDDSNILYIPEQTFKQLI